MLGNIGPLEIAIVLIVALIVFGPKRLPELGNGLGRGIREFKDSVTGEKDDDDDAQAIGASTATTTPVEQRPASPVEASKPAVAHDKEE